MERKFFFSANDYYRELFGEKTYKLSLNAGMSCPNRDGLLDTRGCIFCSAGGSGDFAACAQLSITDQITDAMKRVSRKYSGHTFIAYFQAFTNTYASVDRLHDIFTEAINDSRISGISIATRPDCLDSEKIALLSELNRIKPVWIELGLQTINESTAQYIRRGYSLEVFDRAFYALKGAGIPVIVHMITGLPYETHDDYMKCADYIAHLPAHGIKIQLLHVLRGTDLAIDYENGLFEEMSLDEYVRTVVDIIEILPPDMVVYRITGDGPKDLLLAPLWSCNKKNVLNSITKEFIKRNSFQGMRYK